MLLFFPPQPIVYFVFVIVFFFYFRSSFIVITRLPQNWRSENYKKLKRVGKIRKKLGNFTKFSGKLKFLTLKKFKVVLHLSYDKCDSFDTTNVSKFLINSEERILLTDQSKNAQSICSTTWIVTTDFKLTD